MRKTLVAYFSVSGTTARVAKELARVAGADLYEIQPQVPYTKADLNWMNERSRSSVEMRDRHSRPALADRDADIAAYDAILLGFPIWWYVAPTIVDSFLESYDFTGKVIAPFCTSGSSPFGESDVALKEAAPGANWRAGKRFSARASEGEFRAWLSELDLDAAGR